MIYAEKGNKIVEISAEQKQIYLERGFDIKDDNGIVQRAKVNDIVELEKICDDLRAENEALKAEITKLKTKKEKAAPVPATESIGDEPVAKTPRKRSANK